MGFDNTKIQNTLDEFKEETGISLSFEGSNLSEEETIEKLNEILNRARGREDRNFFIRQFLLGQKSGGEIADFFKKQGAGATERAVLLLVSFRQKVASYDITVLSGVFSSRNVRIIEIDDNDVAILLSERKKESEESLFETANAVRDIINTECMKDASIYYDSVSVPMVELPEVYKNLLFTKNIAQAFYSPLQVYSFHKLGIKKLLYRLPADACEEYLKDTVPGFDFKKLDPDLKSTIKAFIDCDLSVAETSRSTYVHRNTLNYRLDKFEKMSGLNIRKFDDAMLCRIGMMISDML